MKGWVSEATKVQEGIIKARQQNLLDIAAGKDPTTLDDDRFDDSEEEDESDAEDNINGEENADGIVAGGNVNDEQNDKGKDKDKGEGKGKAVTRGAGEVASNDAPEGKNWTARKRRQISSATMIAQISQLTAIPNLDL